MSQKPISPLHQRMLEDTSLRGLLQQTVSTQVYWSLEDQTKGRKLIQQFPPAAATMQSACGGVSSPSTQSHKAGHCGNHPGDDNFGMQRVTL